VAAASAAQLGEPRESGHCQKEQEAFTGSINRGVLLLAANNGQQPLSNDWGLSRQFDREDDHGNYLNNQNGT